MIAAKWVDCVRCACVQVLVTHDFDGDVLCGECIAERGTLETNPIARQDAPGSTPAPPAA